MVDFSLSRWCSHKLNDLLGRTVTVYYLDLFVVVNFYWFDDIDRSLTGYYYYVLHERRDSFRGPFKSRGAAQIASERDLVEDLEVRIYES